MRRVICRRAVTGFALGLLAGCASYSALPLEPGGGLRPSLAALDHGDQPLPERLAPSDVGRLALLNNPDLRLGRAKRGLAQAQLLAAGLLPNPSISANYAFLLAGPGSIAALGAGLTQDLRAFITLPARRDAARAEARQLDASMLWDEWQVIGKAQLLAVDVIEGSLQLRILEDHRAMLQDRLQRGRAALANGDLALADVAPDLAAVTDADRQVDDLARQQLGRRHNVQALLGLTPDADVPMADRIDLPEVDVQAIAALLPGLEQRRPDLVALQLAYLAQEDRVRGAVLSQFPALSVGAAYGRDSSDIHTLGPQMSIDLPVFDHGQGAVAVQRATRRQLHDEYSQRVDAARSEVTALVREMGLLRGQLAGRVTQLPDLELAAERAAHAHRRGDLDERALLDALGTLAVSRLQVVVLEQAILEQQVALATVTGAGLPQVSPITQPDKR